MNYINIALWIIGICVLLKVIDFLTSLLGEEPNDIFSKNGKKYNEVPEENIPKWVWKKVDKNISGYQSFKGKKYRYVVQYVGGGMFDCWRRKRCGK
jgi:hypothetical protein